MTDVNTTNALRLLQVADDFRAGLSGEFSAVHGISVNEFFLLLHLERAPANRLSRVEMAKRMHVSASTITRMAAPMEKIGLAVAKSTNRTRGWSSLWRPMRAERNCPMRLRHLPSDRGTCSMTDGLDKEVEQFSTMLNV